MTNQQAAKLIRQFNEVDGKIVSIKRQLDVVKSIEYKPPQQVKKEYSPNLLFMIVYGLLVGFGLRLFGISVIYTPFLYWGFAIPLAIGSVYLDNKLFNYRNQLPPVKDEFLLMGEKEVEMMLLNGDK